MCAESKSREYAGWDTPVGREIVVKAGQVLHRMGAEGRPYLPKNYVASGQV
jgi:hypothetical protein